MIANTPKPEWVKEHEYGERVLKRLERLNKKSLPPAWTRRELPVEYLRKANIILETYDWLRDRGRDRYKFDVTCTKNQLCCVWVRECSVWESLFTLVFLRKCICEKGRRELLQHSFNARLVISIAMAALAAAICVLLL
jgi:hypothetical protein